VEATSLVMPRGAAGLTGWCLRTRSVAWCGGNPGGPYGHAAEGEFGTHSDYRNPLLTARLAAAGYVQQLGRGVRRARLQLEKNGNPPLVVETDGFTRVVVRRRA